MSVLERILAAKRADLAREQEALPMRRLIELAKGAPPPRDFAGALRRPSDGLHVIAEIKRASPSRGGIRQGADVGAIARAYEAAGAAAVSVLTEQHFFLGSPEDLTAAKESIGLPVLRKDFVFDEYQVYQSRLMGADAVLLIARVLERRDLERLVGVTRSLHMEALVEIHETEEIARAAAAGAAIVGVNNRDLATLAVSIDTSLRLAAALPAGMIRVSESGIESHADLERLRQAGYQAALVGERLMRETDPGAALRALRGEGGA
ncbi:MAG: indole-3-glycerol phosphate synthase TrpC [Candidatus Polarisedimenticolia bacterium]